MDNTADLIRYGTMDIDMLEPATLPVGASTDLDVRESYESYQSTPRVEPEPKSTSRFLKSNKPKVCLSVVITVGYGGTGYYDHTLKH